MLGALLAATGILSCIPVLAVMKKSGKFFKTLLLSAAQGVVSLLAVNAAGRFTGVLLHVNALTLASGVLFGSAGTLWHLIARVLLR